MFVAISFRKEILKKIIVIVFISMKFIVIVVSLMRITKMKMGKLFIDLLQSTLLCTTQRDLCAFVEEEIWDDHQVPKALFP